MFGNVLLLNEPFSRTPEEVKEEEAMLEALRKERDTMTVQGVHFLFLDA